MEPGSLMLNSQGLSNNRYLSRIKLISSIGNYFFKINFNILLPLRLGLRILNVLWNPEV